MSVALVIPALNEAATIGDVISQAQKYGTIIVVDDGSSDGTAEIASNAGAIVVSHDVNKGIDQAIASGYKKAIAEGFKYVVTLDADGQHNPTQLKKIIDPLVKDEADFVIGIRPKPARFSEFIFHLYTKHQYGMEDALSGLKGFHTKICKQFIHITEMPTIGTGLALAAKREGYRLKQVPIEIRERVGNPRVGRTIRANYIILKALFREVFTRDW